MNDKKQEVVQGINISKSDLDKLMELANSPIKRIYSEGHTTMIEFENGQLLPLYGGGSEILDHKELSCSFCNRVRSEVGHLAAPPDRDDPLICPDCAVMFVELFLEHGVEIKLDITNIAPDLADQLSKLSDQTSKDPK